MSADEAVLIVGDDSSQPSLTDLLAAAGLVTEVVSEPDDALRWLESRVPGVIVLDSPDSDPKGFDFIREVRSRPHLTDVSMVVLKELGSEDEVDRILAAGADDCVVKPFRRSEMVARIRSQLRMREYVRRLNRRERDQQTVLELTQLLASTPDIRDALFTVVQRVAAVAQVHRCSIVLTSENGDQGYVVASSDDETMCALSIDTAKYPEIREVLSTGLPLVIQDAGQHPLLEAVRKQEPAMTFSSIALTPILRKQHRLGVIFMRSRATAAFGDHEMSLVSTVANALGIALQNATILRSMRDETRQSVSARVEAERRVRLFQRYADFFESAADGMVVIGGGGAVLLSNPRAREITGFSEGELMQQGLADLLSPEEQDRAQRLLRGFSEGIYPRGVDITIINQAGSRIVINVSFSSVLHEDEVVLFSFRDVTLERKTAVELRQTKEFLERVIDSSVDAIVFCDLDGIVLLYNRAAARIFRYAPHDVIGKINVDRLYPAGVARDVMRMIRNPELHGYGRLEDYRVDMLTSDGERVPVVLSAALVMQDGRPVGSVGIFTDIRDRLRMQASLYQAQEELAAREKQSIVAELAGAAAHELNQPLTSVIGYAELLKRGLKSDPHLQNAAEIIIKEAERMAEIVRKVGTITKYETKTYVGGAKILDLEKASERGG